MRSSAVLLLVVTVVGAALFSRASPSLEKSDAVIRQQPSSVATAPDEASRLVDAIKALPPWPTCNNLAPKEWKMYVSVAQSVQAAPEETVARALATFGDRLPWGEGDRLMILLRVVFDVPIDTAGRQRPKFVAACGGIPAHPPGPHPRGLGEPVWWTGERFVLTAYQSVSGGTTGPGGAFYYPLAEYDYFSVNFRLRKLDVIK